MRQAGDFSAHAESWGRGHKPGAEEPESVETAKVKPKRKVGVQHSEVSSQGHQGDFRSNH